LIFYNNGAVQNIPAFPTATNGNPAYVLGADGAWASRKNLSGTYGAVSGQDDGVYFGEKNPDNETYHLVAACSEEVVRQQNTAFLQLLSPGQPYPVYLSIDTGKLRTIQDLRPRPDFTFNNADGSVQSIPDFSPATGLGNPLYKLGTR
jgi:hypothetical protein